MQPKIAARLRLLNTGAVNKNDPNDARSVAIAAMRSPAVGTGLHVMAPMMRPTLGRCCGPKSRHDKARTATRHGSEDGSVTLGGRRVPGTPPRRRATDGSRSCPSLRMTCSPDRRVGLVGDGTYVGRAVDASLPGRPRAGRAAGIGVGAFDGQVSVAGLEN